MYPVHDFLWLCSISRFFLPIWKISTSIPACLCPLVDPFVFDLLLYLLILMNQSSYAVIHFNMITNYDVGFSIFWLWSIGPESDLYWFGSLHVTLLSSLYFRYCCRYSDLSPLIIVSPFLSVLLNCNFPFMLHCTSNLLFRYVWKWILKLSSLNWMISYKHSNIA